VFDDAFKHTLCVQVGSADEISRLLSIFILFLR
jgi:hypothetical protein